MLFFDIVRVQLTKIGGLTVRILWIYPKFAQTFWNLQHLLRFVDKRAAFPPLGLLTVAAMLPKSWSQRVVDLNIRELSDGDIRWADYVFISAMTTQGSSARDVIARCKRAGVPVVLGGPILELSQKRFPGVRHFLLGETENTLPRFLEDLQAGRAGEIYPAINFPDISSSPIPRWDLIKPKHYACLLVQFGRGCPHQCTFCNIHLLNGRVPRTKSVDQFMRELDAMYKSVRGARISVMFADDNFIGNKAKVRELLPRLVEWQQKYGYPFEFAVEADVTIADDPELMHLMVKAGFKKVFLGIETPNEAALAECRKWQNLRHKGKRRDLADCVRKIQNNGLHPITGLIVGFDSDGPDIFEEMRRFCESAGLVLPMVSVLQALPGTQLHERMKKEGRLLKGASGNNTFCDPNFVTRMPRDVLVRGYKWLAQTIYSPREHYKRMRVFLREYRATRRMARKPTVAELKAFATSIFRIGLFGGIKTSYYYWKTLLLAFFKNRAAFPDAVSAMVYLIHFRKAVKNI